MLLRIPVHTPYRSERSPVHPLDRGYHEISAASVLLLTVSVHLSICPTAAVFYQLRPLSRYRFLNVELSAYKFELCFDETKCAVHVMKIFPFRNFRTGDTSDQ